MAHTARRVKGRKRTGVYGTMIMPAPIPLPSDSNSGETRALSSIEKSLYASQVVEELRTVYDPELPVNIYDLGLIYDIQVSDRKDVHIMMTLTSPACPVAGSLPGEVECAARATPGVGNVTVELTWDPPFTVDRMSQDVRLMLGID